ncbi:uncharacterized protein MONOS_13642 [Monocercomonoides exilis]|uniref:uncharacterized protein n=1 Tax=Monocercomonoides exilis TaxID=2049356 RepID=UPI0035593DE2|nr:hypothetical protein MONOS_13642 [Monocercomonoides exilis]|eukprot:MONOS_13642.1-p1 / transcript=MONOS_13642.1 / gene=MONOS_13642 / organism=Monocercomonoides_exilis_PA203 / gene_product=unspecified product / transcript_product=unspecified product / location=Mono_scaffold00857:11083-14025(-) / protein_length=981 / sequence_SO=supercontig / SO=protein_coding / is_pseudo=false
MFWGLILVQVVISVYSQDDPSKPVTTVFLKQSGNNSNSGLYIGQERQSLYSAYSLLSDNCACFMKVVYDTELLTADTVTFRNKQKVTVEGVNNEGSGNTEVAMDCDINPGQTLFNCYCDMEFKCIAFHFPATLAKEPKNDEILALINEQRASLTISSCRFIRPAGENVIDFRLVYQYQGSLTMESVECLDEENAFKSEYELFSISNADTIILSNLALNNIEIINDYDNGIYTDSVINVNGYAKTKVDLILNGSTFSDLKSTSKILSFTTDSDKSTFTVGDGGVTTFSSCHGDFYYGSGGIYLRMLAIESASQIKWPKDGRNLIFDKCTVGEGQSKRDTGLLLMMANDSLFEDIAVEMKKSFATNYTRNDNLWFVAACVDGTEKIFDFVSKYFDLIGKIFVKNKGTGDGLTSYSPLSSLKVAYDKLDEVLCSVGYFIEIVKDESQFTAEEMTISNEKGITIEGVNSNGNGNVEVAIDCDVRAMSALFTCEKEVEFKYLAFNFPTLENKWNSLIFGNEMSTSLTISNCRFVRVGTQSSSDEMNTNDDGDGVVEGRLVNVLSGKVTLNNVSCADDSICVSFFSSPFFFSGVSSASLNGVEISNVNIQKNAIFLIQDLKSHATKIAVEGMLMKEVSSELGEAAGMEIYLYSEESTLTIGRKSKCTFKKCSAPMGKSGAIYIWMTKITPNLQLPSANNLEIDGSNTANSSSRSICIVAKDFEEFCKQEDAFEFAKDFDESAAGWIVGAKDEESEPEDAYEKYLKRKKDQESDPESDTVNKGDPKTKAGTIVAIVVPIVVVIVAAAVICIILISVKRKKRINVEREENALEGETDEREEEECRSVKNPVMESNSIENTSTIQHLGNTTHDISKTEEHLQKDEKREGISNEFIEEAVNQILSPSSSSVLTEGLQSDTTNVNLKEFVKGTSTFSIQASEQNDGTGMADEEIKENSTSEEKEKKKERKTQKLTHLIENIEMENEKGEEE